MLEDVIKLLDAGYALVPCKRDKSPFGKDWPNAWRNRDKLVNFVRSNRCNIGLLLDGKVIDIEWDGEAEKQLFDELFDGCELPHTPNFRSTRGEHWLFAGDSRINATGKDVHKYKRKLGVRIGADGGAQSVIPRSFNQDGTQREWTISLLDCTPAPLPELVIERILKDAAPRQATASATSGESGDVSPAVTEMLRMDMQDGNDGSKRLFACCCRAVEHDLSDSAAIAAIRQVESSKPFPRSWSDDEILTRLRDAEKRTQRGIAGTYLFTTQGQTDAANAKRLAIQFGNRIRWCDPWSKWHVWDDQRWREDDCRRIDALAKRTAKSLWEQIANAI